MGSDFLNFKLGSTPHVVILDSDDDNDYNVEGSGKQNHQKSLFITHREQRDISFVDCYRPAQETICSNSEASKCMKDSEVIVDKDECFNDSSCGTSKPHKTWGSISESQQSVSTGKSARVHADSIWKEQRLKKDASELMELSEKLAIMLQHQECVEHLADSSKERKDPSLSSPLDFVADEETFPDLHSLFQFYDAQYFNSTLGSVEVKWSNRMTLCAGVCSYQVRSYFEHVLINLY